MIKFSKVTKSFPGLFKPVLNDISFSLNKGDFCILIGANGCGKSTLMKLLSGALAPERGRVTLDGDVAQVVQDTHLGTVPEMTLLENVALSEIKKPELAFYTRYRQTVFQKLKAIGIGLEEYIDRPVQTLSGGQRQIIATLMAINAQKEILLLDEHTSALDPKMQHLLMLYTAKEIKQRSLTAAMITHKMDDAVHYGNRLIMLHQGKIVLDLDEKQKSALTPQELLAMFHEYEDQLLISEDGNDA